MQGTWQIKMEGPRGTFIEIRLPEFNFGQSSECVLNVFFVNS